jgi:hypothetical protein
MIEVTLPPPVHFCPLYPARILVAPAGTKKVKLEIDAFYTIDSYSTTMRILSTDELERRLAAGAILFAAKSLADLQPLIDRAGQLVRRGFDVSRLFPPDDAEPCDWCPVNAA